MDDVNNQKQGLNRSFRRSVLNMIMKKLIEGSNQPTDPTTLSKLNERAIMFEGEVYKRATSKDNYMSIVCTSLNAARRCRNVASPTAENQTMNNMIQRQIVQSNQCAQQNLNARSSPHENQISIPSTLHPIHGPRRPMSMPTSTLSAILHQRNAPMQPATYNQLQQGPVFEHQNVLHKRDSLQQMACTRAPPSSSFLDTDTTTADDWKLLIAQRNLVWRKCLSDLIALHERAMEDCAKAQGEEDKREKSKYVTHYKNMINVLQIPESDLKQFNQDLLRQWLNSIVHLIRKSSTVSATGNQVPQVGQISVNNQQNNPSAGHTIFASNRVISSTMEKVCEHSQSITDKGPQNIAEQNVHLNLKRNSEQMQQPSNMDYPKKIQQLRKPPKLQKERDFMDSMFIASPKITSRKAQHNLSVGRPESFKPLLQKRSTSCISDPRAMSQHNPSVVEVDSAATPVMPSSVVNETRERAQSNSLKKITEIEGEPETEVQDKSAETNQPPVSEVLRPIDRLIRAVQSTTKENLKSAVNDIALAINDVSKLPDHAFY